MSSLRVSHVVMSGPDALVTHQYTSTLVCAMLGSVLLILFTAGGLVFLGLRTNIIAIGVVTVAFGTVPLLYTSVQFYNSMPEEDLYHYNTEADGNDCSTEEGDERAPALRAWRSYVVTQPKAWYCWCRFLVTFVVLFLCPLVYKFAAGMPKSGTFFLVAGVISGCRLHLDAGSIVKEFGTLDVIGIEGNSKKEQSFGSARQAQVMISRARASEMMGKISHNRLWLWFWIVIYAGLAALFLAVLCNVSKDQAHGLSAEPTAGRPPIRLLDDFYWPPQPDVSYPICRLQKNYTIQGREQTHITDYNMMTALSYEAPSVTTYILGKWFQEEGFFVDETRLVAQWKEDSGNANTIMSFKLFSSASHPGVGIVAIRGTETAADMFLNFQMYAPSFLTNIIEHVIPYRWIFQPILPWILYVSTWIGSEHLRTANFYSVITQFIKDLTENHYTFEGKSFHTLRLTGVSLAGGIAMISGAQTGSSVIAFAAANPILAIHTIVPPISAKDIDATSMNIVPDRDVISRIGGRIRGAQSINCRDWPAPYKKCHSFWKQMCEFMYSCGSEGRPVLCICTERFSYPEPLPRGNRTYAQACREEEDLFMQQI